jgi:recombination protein RecR
MTAAVGGNGFTDSLARLVEEFRKLPGIGSKTAERLAFHVLKVSTEKAMALAYAIRDVKRNVRRCVDCFHLSEKERCAICEAPGRDRSVVCVVESELDLIAIERSQAYRGLYHVLMGRVSPLDGIGPEQLTMERLVSRVRAAGGEVREVILATNPDVEGDGTALHVAELLRDAGVRVTRIAKGMPAGSQIEYVSDSILKDALSGRKTLP